MVFSNKSTKKNTRSFIFSLLVLGSFTALSAHAATVTLNNGDQVTGELLQLTDSTLTFKSGIFGKVNIPWKDVSKLVSDEGVRIQLKDGTTVKGKVVLDKNGAVAIDQGRLGQSKTLTRQDLAALNPPITDNAVKYSGHLDLGGSFNRGNSSDDQLNVNGEFIARTPKNRYTVGVEVNEAKSAGVKTTSNRRLLTQYDAFLNDKNYLFVSAKAETDRLADLNLRTSLGAGYGRQFIDSDIARFSGEAGLSYVNEDHIISADHSFPTLRLGLKYNRKFFDKKLVYFQDVTMDTNLKDTKDILVHNRLGLRMPIAKGVNLSTQLNVDYDNQPALNTRKTDTALIFSVGYGF